MFSLALTALLITAAAPELTSIYVVLEGDGTSSGRALRELEAQRKELEPHLAGLGAEVVADHRGLVNALQVLAPKRALEKLTRLPHVERLDRVSIVYPALTEAIMRTRATDLWTSGLDVTGRNVRIAVLDSGVDYLHADFGGSPDPRVHATNDPRVIEPSSFPTEKVVAGYDLVGDDYEPGTRPAPDADPLDCASTTLPGHGTMVSSIAAGYGVTSSGTPYRGSYAMSFDASAFSIGPGVAPEASLYAVKIYGCAGQGTDMVIAGLEWAVDPNRDGDFADRADVINLSFGTPFGQGSRIENEALQRAIELGVVIVASVGNDSQRGRGFFAAGWPSTAPGVISVGGTLNDERSFHLFHAAGANGASLELRSLEGLTPPLAGFGLIQGPVYVPSPLEGCAPYTEDLSGKIVVTLRGVCTFLTKFEQAANAGAEAVLVIDLAYDLYPEPIGSASTARIPGGMITRGDGDRLLALLELGEVIVTLDPDVRDPRTYGPDAIGSLSVRGPGAEDGTLKPDLVAPCCDVVIPVSGTGNVAGETRGTSASAPMVAGAAALLLSLNPELDPLDLKAALLNSAQPVRMISGELFPVTFTGAGRLDVAAAADAKISLRNKQAPELATLSFPEIAAESVTEARIELELTVRTPERTRFDLSAALTHAVPGVSLRVEPAEVLLDRTIAKTVTLILSVDPALLPAATPDAFTAGPEEELRARHSLLEVSGFVTAESPDGALGRLPFFAAVRPADHMEAKLGPACAGEPLQVSFDRKDSTNSRAPTAIFDLIEGTGSGDVAAVGHAYADGVLYLAIAANQRLPTPATYPLPKLHVAIDTDRDGQPDFRLMLDGLDLGQSGAASYRDLLQVKVTPALFYDPAVAYPFQPINGLAPELAATFPYFNDVWILPVKLTDLEISDASAPIDLAVHVGALELGALPEDFFTLVPNAPRIDAAEGAAIYSFDGAAKELRYAGDRPSGKALVVTPSGGEGHRRQVLELDAVELLGGDSTFEARFIEDELEVAITNRGPHATELDIVLEPGLLHIEAGRLIAGEGRTLRFPVSVPGEELTVSLYADACSAVSAPQTLSVPSSAQLQDEESCSCASTPPADRFNGAAVLLLAAALLRRPRARR